MKSVLTMFISVLTMFGGASFFSPHPDEKKCPPHPLGQSGQSIKIYQKKLKAAYRSKLPFGLLHEVEIAQHTLSAVAVTVPLCRDENFFSIE